MTKAPQEDASEQNLVKVQPRKKKAKQGADTSTGRPTGRPRGRHDPDIDWDRIENDYVWGETIEKRPDGSYRRKYPSFIELGEKYGVSKSLVHYYAKKHQWHERRLAAVDKTKEEFDAELAKSRARRTVDAIEVLDSWLLEFAENVRLKKVRADSIGDLNTVVRLKKFMQGDADSRTEQRVVVSLEQLQERHRGMRARVVEAEGAVAGELEELDILATTGELPEEGSASGA